jgi:hypothetical protein
MEKNNRRRNFNKKPHFKNKKHRDNGDHPARNHYSSNKFNNEVKNAKVVAESSQNPKFVLSEDEGITMCSFFVFNNSDPRLVMQILSGVLHENIHNLVISLHKDNATKIQEEIVERFKEHKNKIFFQEYLNESEFAMHNLAFKTYKSDAFFVTNSNMEPRLYSLEILRKYLSRENSVVTVPTVYDESLAIKKYSIRFPTLLSRLKILFGSKTEQQRSIMMERGEVGYYKIHRISASKSQAFFVNSRAFESIGMFPKSRDTDIILLKFFKKISKCGFVLFIPTARFIEHEGRFARKCSFSKARYFMTNVF